MVQGLTEADVTDEPGFLESPEQNSCVSSRFRRFPSIYDEDSDPESISHNEGENFVYANPSIGKQCKVGTADSVLGNIQCLRSICNMMPTKDDKDIDVALLASSKLQIVDNLLQSLNELNLRESNISKIVIVSNFTKMLDQIECLVKKRSYGECLRIDGQVSIEKRQDFVDCFNRKSEVRYNIFLLSAKAGGVGLNLYVLVIFC